MTDSLQVTDDQSKAVQKTPNRVALADIEAAIWLEMYCQPHDIANAIMAKHDHVAERAEKAGEWVRADVDRILYDHPAMTTPTVCVMILHNGFVVVGFSAPADGANFDAELGRKFARENAVRQLWPLMGFALRDRLHQGPPQGKVAARIEQDDDGA